MPAHRAPRRRIITALIMASTAVATLALGTATAHAASLAPALSWSPTTSSNTFDYGNVPVGTGPTQTFTLRNSGLLPTGRVTVSLTGDSAFTITADSCTGRNLAYNKTCTVTVRYSPGAVAENTATLTAQSVFGARASLTLRGTGVATTGTLTASYTFANGLSVSGSGLLPGSEVDVHFVSNDPTDPTKYGFAVGMADAHGMFTWTERPPCYWRYIYFTGTDSFGSVTSNTIYSGPYC